uniref:Uncharacterized protein n=1 Tax=Timema bartmani TaxID=61472 RepID=A0A7R9F9P7_9NEOP|nr:unnamed protein product [Timema bartmani]
MKGKWKTVLSGKTSPNRSSSPDRPVIRSPVYCESDGYAATEVKTHHERTLLLTFLSQEIAQCTRGGEGVEKSRAIQNFELFKVVIHSKLRAILYFSFSARDEKNKCTRWVRFRLKFLSARDGYGFRSSHECDVF